MHEKEMYTEIYSGIKGTVYKSNENGLGDIGKFYFIIILHQ